MCQDVIKRRYGLDATNVGDEGGLPKYVAHIPEGHKTRLAGLRAEVFGGGRTQQPKCFQILVN